MSWTEIVLEVPRQQAELVSDALIEAGALSVSVEDANEGTEAEQPLFGEPGMEPTEHAWENSRVVALINASDDPAELVHQVCAMCDIDTLLPFTLRSVADQDWVRLTQSQFAPVEITPEFWIVPTWHEPPSQARKIIRLDPGLAFGTGTHPTTRMCLRWIATHEVKGQRVLDYGCGSGILAIGAAKFGAKSIDAVDIDEAAVTSTNLNAQANEVSLNAGLPDLAAGTYQTVLANILATPLKVLAPLLCQQVEAGGHLVLAGILERQEEELIQAYAPFLSLSVADREDGWILMTAQRPTAT